MEPITREEMYLAAAAGYDVTPPDPITRREHFLAELAGMEVETPTPYTRSELFLSAAAANVSKAVIEELTITENGTYTAPDGVDGYNPVVVEVPEPALQELTVTENGEYTPDDGYDGLSKVTVDVPEQEITLQEKEVKENGTYTADDGFDALSKIIVNVAATGTAAIVKKGIKYNYIHNGEPFTVTHNLGVIPDLIVIMPLDGTPASAGIMAVAASPTSEGVIPYRYGTRLMRYTDGSYGFTSYLSSIYGAPTVTQWGLNVTETTFYVSSAVSGIDYYWIAMSGIT